MILFWEGLYIPKIVDTLASIDINSEKERQKKEEKMTHDNTGMFIPDAHVYKGRRNYS